MEAKSRSRVKKIQREKVSKQYATGCVSSDRAVDAIIACQ